MTLEETRDGGVFAHILIVLYVFGALAIVCDDYFCASLEVICDGKIYAHTNVPVPAFVQH